MCWDGEPATIHEEMYRKSRKEHKCCACRETIRPGDKYHVTEQLFDGSFERYKHCLRCWEIVGEILDAGAEAIDYTLNCGEAWEENFGDLPEKVARLAFVTPDEAQKEFAP